MEAEPAEEKTGLVLGAIAWLKSKRADRSREGFDAAFAAAVEFCSAYEYETIRGMQDDIFLVMSDRLRHGDIEIEFIAWHSVTRRPRMSVRSGRYEAREDITVKFTPGITARAN